MKQTFITILFKHTFKTPLIIAMMATFGIAKADTTIWGGTPVSSNNPIALYSVALAYKKTPDAKTSYCSASLITPHHALTAAHCIKLTNAPEYHLHFGVKADSPVQISKVTQQYIHEGYVDSWPQMNDIAILEFEQEAPAGFLPIQMNTNDTDLISDKPNPTVSGYGSNNYGVLHKYEFNASSQQSSPYQTYSRYYMFYQDYGGACNGDSGGSFVVFNKQSPLLIGVSQAGGKINDRGQCKGTLYVTSVSRNIDWIKNTLKNSEKYPVKL